MLWTTLRKNLERTPAKITDRQHIHVLIRNPKTGIREPVFLRLGFDVEGNPYLIQDEKPHADPRRPMKRHRK